MHHYEAWIDTRSIKFYGDDIRARKIVSRWIGIFNLSEKYASKVCYIYRSGRLLPGQVIPAIRYTKLDSFELCEEAVSEFKRIAR